VDINQPTTITCIASDPDGDSLTYDWTVNAGSFEGSTSVSSVTWRAPSTADIYIVVGCEVSDGKGGDDTDTLNIVVTEPDTTLSAPNGVDASNGTYEDKVKITWNSVTSASYYHVYRADSPGGTKTALGSWQSNRYYYDYEVTPGTHYFYFVKAASSNSGADESPFSASDEGWAKDDIYTITASAGSHGSISPSGSITVNQGSDKSFTITPNTGYQIDDVLVDGSSMGAVSSYTFTNVTQDHTIYATFVSDPSGIVIEFEDPGLEQAIRENISKPEGPLYLSNVIGITELSAGGRGIISLEGIQHLQNLEKLYFPNNQVTDISALSNLTNL